MWLILFFDMFWENVGALRKVVDVSFFDVGVLKFGISAKKGFRLVWLIFVFYICYGNVDFSDLASPKESSFDRRIVFRRKSLPSFLHQGNLLSS